ncbi:MAG TPA: 4'-phosphopantetheinyl transferase superfamily protein [Stenomitos sp.]
MQPKQGELQPGAIHVWSAQLPQADVWGQIYDQGQEILSPDERQRAERSLDAHGGSAVEPIRFVATRVLLRRLLGQYLNCSPAQLSFTYSEHGKPALAGFEDDKLLQFNVSHSAERMVCAISAQIPVGVDVEVTNPAANYEAIARRICCPDEWIVLSALDPVQRREVFLKIWTRKEAVIKLNGDRLFAGLRRYPVPVQLQCQGEWLEMPNQQIWLQDLNLWEDTAAAIALSGQPTTITHAHWQW